MLTTILYVICWFVMFLTTFVFFGRLYFKQHIAWQMNLTMAAAWTGLVTHWLGMWF